MLNCVPTSSDEESLEPIRRKEKNLKIHKENSPSLSSESDGSTSDSSSSDSSPSVAVVKGRRKQVQRVKPMFCMCDNVLEESSVSLVSEIYDICDTCFEESAKKEKVKSKTSRTSISNSKAKVKHAPKTTARGKKSLAKPTKTANTKVKKTDEKSTKITNTRRKNEKMKTTALDTKAKGKDSQAKKAIKRTVRTSTKRGRNIKKTGKK